MSQYPPPYPGDGNYMDSSRQAPGIGFDFMNQSKDLQNQPQHLPYPAAIPSYNYGAQPQMPPPPIGHDYNQYPNNSGQWPGCQGVPDQYAVTPYNQPPPNDGYYNSNYGPYQVPPAEYNTNHGEEVSGGNMFSKFTAGGGIPGGKAGVVGGAAAIGVGTALATNLLLPKKLKKNKLVKYGLPLAGAGIGGYALNNLNNKKQ